MTDLKISELVVSASPISAAAQVPVNDAGANKSVTVQQIRQPVLDALAAAIAAINGVPAGTLLDFASPIAPAGYLACDGAAVSRATYSVLFAAIGTLYGAGDGSSTFNLPDFRRRVAVGSGGTPTAVLPNTVGSVGGAETHTLTIPEMPAHTHQMLGSATGVWGDGYDYGPNNTAGPFNTLSTGGGGAHNNMQPSVVVLKIIKT